MIRCTRECACDCVTVCVCQAISGYILLIVIPWLKFDNMCVHIWIYEVNWIGLNTFTGTKWSNFTDPCQYITHSHRDMCWRVPTVVDHQKRKTSHRQLTHGNKRSASEWADAHTDEHISKNFNDNSVFPFLCCSRSSRRWCHLCWCPYVQSIFCAVKMSARTQPVCVCVQNRSRSQKVSNQ